MGEVFIENYFHWIWECCNVRLWHLWNVIFIFNFIHFWRQNVVLKFLRFFNRCILNACYHKEVYFLCIHMRVLKIVMIWSMFFSYLGLGKFNCHREEINIFLRYLASNLRWRGTVGIRKFHLNIYEKRKPAGLYRPRIK